MPFPASRVHTVKSSPRKPCGAEPAEPTVNYHILHAYRTVHQTHCDSSGTYFNRGTQVYRGIIIDGFFCLLRQGRYSILTGLYIIFGAGLGTHGTPQDGTIFTWDRMENLGRDAASTAYFNVSGTSPYVLRGKQRPRDSPTLLYSGSTFVHNVYCARAVDYTTYFDTIDDAPAYGSKQKS